MYSLMIAMTSLGPYGAFAFGLVLQQRALVESVFEPDKVLVAVNAADVERPETTLAVAGDPQQLEERVLSSRADGWFIPEVPQHRERFGSGEPDVTSAFTVIKVQDEDGVVETVDGGVEAFEVPGELAERRHLTFERDGRDVGCAEIVVLVEVEWLVRKASIRWRY